MLGEVFVVAGTYFAFGITYLFIVNYRSGSAHIQSHSVMFLITWWQCSEYLLYFIFEYCVHPFIIFQSLSTHHHEWTKSQFSSSLSPQLITQLTARHLTTMTRYHLLINSVKCECTFFIPLNPTRPASPVVSAQRFS